MKALVINLARRPERLKGFLETVGRSIPNIARIEAIDGQELTFDQALRARVNPWNFQHLTDKKLCGVVGCALSHMEAWQKLAASADPFALIFEDDARFVTGPRHLHATLAALPNGFDLVWLNEYDRDPQPLTRRVLNRLHLWNAWCKLRSLSRPAFRAWPATTEKTAEAYVISRTFAATLIERFYNDIGAIDECMRSASSGAKVYAAWPPVFRQGLCGTDIQVDQ